MKLKKKKKTKGSQNPAEMALKNEQAMIAGIIEGSPDAIGVAIVRLTCGCKKMAALKSDGEPASKVIIYRDEATEVCSQCKEDDGAFSRVKESLIHWEEPLPDPTKREEIELKVLGNRPVTH